MPLLNLPNELLLLISSHLPTPSLNSLLQTSHHLSHLLLPTLYTLALHHHPHNKAHTGAHTLHVLHWASTHGHARPIHLLLQNGAPITHPSTHNTALHLAALYGHTSAINALLTSPDAAVAVTLQNRTIDGHTPLHLAAWNGHADAVRALLEYGVSPEQPSRTGARALNYAVQKGHRGVVAVLVEYGCRVDIPADPESVYDTTVLQWIAEFTCWGAMSLDVGFDGVLGVLLANGGDATEVDLRGRTALHYAAGRGEPVARGRVLPVDRFNVGIVAGRVVEAERAHRAVVRALVGAGADVNARDLRGRTPLHDAAENGDVKTVRFLVGLGADIGIRDGNGVSALDLAMGFERRRGMKDVAWALRVVTGHRQPAEVEEVEIAVEMVGAEVEPQVRVRRPRRRRYLSWLLGCGRRNGKSR